MPEIFFRRAGDFTSVISVEILLTQTLGQPYLYDNFAAAMAAYLNVPDGCIDLYRSHREGIKSLFCNQGGGSRIK